MDITRNSYIEQQSKSAGATEQIFYTAQEGGAVVHSDLAEAQTANEEALKKQAQDRCEAEQA